MTPEKLPPPPRPDALVAAGLGKEFVTRRSLMGRTRQRVRAVDDVSIALGPGETLGLVGESGSGKSTIARLVTRLIEPDVGTVTLGGVPFSELSGSALRRERRRIQMVFQDPYASLDPTKMIVHTVGEPLTLHEGLRGEERSERVVDLLEQVGLGARYLHRYPYEFSGGQRQRIAIARALAPAPEVLVADEAVSALDVSTQAQVLNLLLELKEARGLAMLFISHDLSVVRHVADRIAVMYLGAIVEQGDVREVYESPRHPYTQALLAAVPEIDPAKRRERIPVDGDAISAPTATTGCSFTSRCPMAMAVCREQTPRPVTVGGVEVACHQYGGAESDDAPVQTPATLRI